MKNTDFSVKNTEKQIKKTRISWARLRTGCPSSATATINRAFQHKWNLLFRLLPG